MTITKFDDLIPVSYYWLSLLAKKYHVDSLLEYWLGPANYVDIFFNMYIDIRPTNKIFAFIDT